MSSWLNSQPWLKAPWRVESKSYDPLQQDELPLIEPGATEVIELDPLAQKKPDLPPAKRSIWRRVLFCVVIVLLLLLLIPRGTFINYQSTDAVVDDKAVEHPRPDLSHDTTSHDTTPPAKDPPAEAPPAVVETPKPAEEKPKPADDTPDTRPVLDSPEPPPPADAPKIEDDEANPKDGRPILDSPEPVKPAASAPVEEAEHDTPSPSTSTEHDTPPPSTSTEHDSTTAGTVDYNDHPPPGAPASEPPKLDDSDEILPPPVPEPSEKSPLDNANTAAAQPHEGPDVAEAGDRNLHLFLPATSGNEHLCKTLFTAAAMGYPTPKLINWGMAPDPGQETVSHLKKVRGIANALAALGPGAANDLVLITDAFDLWFNLPAKTIVSRYHEIIKAEDEYTARLWGQRALDAGMRANSIFAADKGCFGNKRDDHWCYMQPESSLSTELYGNNTDREMGGWGSYTSYRPRYLNSGVIMGPVRNLLATFQRAEDFMTSLGIDSEHDFWQSDQRILSMVYVEQQLARARQGLRNPQWKDNTTGAVENRTSPYTNPTFTPNLDIHPNIPKIKFQTITKQEGEVNLGYEHGIVVDFAARLSQTTNAADHEWAYLHYKGGYPENVPQLGDERDCRLDVKSSLPEDLEGTPVPHGELLSQTGGNTTAEALAWSDLPLYTNLCTGGVPAIIHHNGDKSMREKQWPSLWYTSAGFKIMASLRAAAAAHPDDHVNTGNSITDGGVAMSWGQVCGMEAKRIFGDQLIEYAPGTTSFGVPPRFYRRRR